MRSRDTRPNSRQRGYDKRWEKLRAYHLAKDPFCRYHKAKGQLVQATVVDHIERFRDKPELRLDPDNLQSLCKHCHDSVKQMEERGSKKGCDVNGIPPGWQ